MESRAPKFHDAPPYSLAICGIRGIPARYGGFETFAEELATRLVRRGVCVTVYCRAHLMAEREGQYRGVSLRAVPTFRHKYLETPVHTLRSFVHLLRRPVDVVLICNAANSPFLFIPKYLGRTPVVLNLDGIERLRSKWSAIGKGWYALGERCSTWFSSAMVADAEVIRGYYRERFKVAPEMIPYGYCDAADEIVQRKLRGAPNCGFTPEENGEELHYFQELQLVPGSYLLYVSRFEPENNADKVVQAYGALPPELRARLPLVMVGDAPYAAEFITRVKQLAVPEVRFLGYRFGDEYRRLQLGALLYVQATEVGGTHPALVEAMGFGNCIVANDVPEHREVLGDTGYFYERNSSTDLTRVFHHLLNEEHRRSVGEARCRARLRAEQLYDWERVTSAYDMLFRRLLGVVNLPVAAALSDA